MTLEAILAALHLLAVFTLVVFLTSEAALCRAEWLNAAVVQRLSRLDMICLISLITVLATGLARLLLGAKGVIWYLSTPLFHVKMTIFVIAVALSFKPSATFRRWRKQLTATGALPAGGEIARTRKWLMVQAHLIPLIAVIAVFWARGM